MASDYDFEVGGNRFQFNEPLQEGQGYAYTPSNIATNIPELAKVAADLKLGTQPPIQRPLTDLMGAIPRPPVQVPGTAKVSFPEEARTERPAPVSQASQINPMGRELSKLEEFRRAAVMKNPNAYSPAERSRVLGAIAREQAVVDRGRAEQESEAKAQRKRDIEVEQFGRKQAETAKYREQTLEKRFSLQDTADQAKAARAMGNKAEEIRLRTEASRVLADEAFQRTQQALQAQGKLVGSPEWASAITAETNQLANTLASKFQMSNIEAMRDAKIKIGAKILDSLSEYATPEQQKVASAEAIKLIQEAAGEAQAQVQPPESVVQPATAIAPQGQQGIDVTPVATPATAQASQAQAENTEMMDGKAGYSAEEVAYDKLKKAFDVEANEGRKLTIKASLDNLKSMIQARNQNIGNV